MDFKQFSQRINHHYSERLALRPIALSDAWPLFEATQADGFNEHLLWKRPEHHLPVFERIESIMAQGETGQVAAIAAVVRKTGQFAALYRFAPFADGVEMSLWTHPAFWGGGFGTETTRLAVHAAMAESGANRLYARSMNENKPAQRVLEKVGLKPNDIGTIRDETGLLRHYLVYCMDRSEWSLPDTRAGLQKIATSNRLANLQMPAKRPVMDEQTWHHQHGCELPLDGHRSAELAPRAS
tara:strand:+ start:198 stop:917 length:720 start_codon:yes stop_codon:yes gene_type:complete